MARFEPEKAPGQLQGKVVLVTGGAHGIGEALVRLCVESGAFVCFGDLDEQDGNALVDEIQSSLSGPSTLSPLCFTRTDVTDYQSLIQLFEYCIEKYGRVDSAVSCAGIMEIGNRFDSSLNMDTIREVPDHKVLDVNLLGSLYFARIACVFLRHGRNELARDDKSLTLFSSVGGFKGSPGLALYQSSKHGILGLMRSLRRHLLPTMGIRVNAICPWMVPTAMTAGIESKWRAAGLPVNETIDVAKIVAGVACDHTQNGYAYFIEGGRAWDIEENLNRLEPQWLGEEQSRALAKGQEVLAMGKDWTKKPID